jgi:hypothetical protein
MLLPPKARRRWGVGICGRVLDTWRSCRSRRRRRLTTAVLVLHAPYFTWVLSILVERWRLGYGFAPHLGVSDAEPRRSRELVGYISVASALLRDHGSVVTPYTEPTTIF